MALIESVPFHFEIDWSERFIEEREHETTIQEMWDGSEQRRNLTEVPNRRFTYLVKALGREDDEFQRLQAAIYGGQALWWWAPYWPREKYVVDAVGVDAVSIPVLSTTTMALVVGQGVLLYRNPSYFEVVEVTSINAGFIGVTPTLMDWQAKDKVVPCFRALIAPESQIITHDVDLASAQVTFDLDIAGSSSLGAGPPDAPCNDVGGYTATGTVPRGRLVDNYDGWDTITTSWSDWRIDDRIVKGIITSDEIVPPTYIRLWIVGSGTAGQVTRLTKTLSGFVPGKTYTVYVSAAASAIGNSITTGVGLLPATINAFAGTADPDGNLDIGLEVTLLTSGFLLDYSVWWYFDFTLCTDDVPEEPILVAEVGEQHTYSRKLTRLSTAGGKFSIRPHRAYPVGTHSIHLDLMSVAEIDNFWKWYETVLGACGTFWVPTFQRDLVPLAPISSSDLTFQIQDRGYTDYEFPANRYAIAVVRENGAIVRRQINASVRNGDGTETLTLNQPLGFSFTQGNSNGISFLLYGRMSDDKARLEWWDHDLASVDFTMVELLAPLMEAVVAGDGLGVWGAYNGPIGGGNARFFARYDLSEYVEPNKEYLVRFLVKSLGGQSVDVIGVRVCNASACTSSVKPGSPWNYRDRTYESSSDGTLYADVGHFAMQIGAAAIVECAWIGIFDPNLFPALDDPTGIDDPAYPSPPPTPPGRFIAEVPLNAYALIRDEGMTSLGGCPPTSPHSAICGLLL